MKSNSWTGHLAWVLALAITWIFVLPKIPSELGASFKFFSLRSLAQMVTGLSLIQALGGFLNVVLGTRAGTVTAGLLGGFVSSTAVTATAARTSKSREEETNASVVLYACSTLAMLLEGAAIVRIGLPSPNASVYSVFFAPIAVTLYFAYRNAKKLNSQTHSRTASRPDLLAIGRMSVFLIFIIAVSNLMRQLFGQKGLVVFTTLASFFEIHATVISNTELRNTAQIENPFFILLLAISLAASYGSKLFIVRAMGSGDMYRVVRNWTAIIFIAITCSVVLALFLDSYF